MVILKTESECVLPHVEVIVDLAPGRRALFLVQMHQDLIGVERVHRRHQERLAGRPSR